MSQFSIYRFASRRDLIVFDLLPVAAYRGTETQAGIPQLYLDDVLAIARAMGAVGVALLDRTPSGARVLAERRDLEAWKSAAATTWGRRARVATARGGPRDGEYSHSGKHDTPWTLLGANPGRETAVCLTDSPYAAGILGAAALLDRLYDCGALAAGYQPDDALPFAALEAHWYAERGPTRSARPAAAVLARVAGDSGVDERVRDLCVGLLAPLGDLSRDYPVRYNPAQR
jgi:hypothetical protein